MSIEVAHFHRFTPLKFQSIYAYFEDVRRHLPPSISVDVFECPTQGNSIPKCLQNLQFARRNRAQINHITGDVHYLMMALPPENTILTIHDCVFLNNPSPLRRRILKTFWLDIPVRRAKYITTVSEATKQQIVQQTGCAASKISVINTTVKSHFRPMPREFNSHQPRLLHIGTAPNKNGLRIIEALKGIPCELIIVGELNNSYKAALEIAQVNFVNLTNLSDEALLQCYANCDALLFPSLLEGFGMPIVEAQMVGRPVLTSHSSSMPEVAGNAALFVDPKDSSSIRAGVKQIISDESLRSNMVNLGFENAKRFNIRDISEKYTALYRRLDKNSKKRIAQ